MWDDAVRRATKAALVLRRRYGVSLASPCDVYALTESMGVTVQFTATTSFDGMFLRAGDVPRLIVSAARPPGRRAFSTAHELGHHVLGHGALSVLVLGGAADDEDEEREANAFAGTLLMPPPAVRLGFEARGWRPESASAEQVYVVSTWLGVGYTTLVKQLRWALKAVSPGRQRELVKVTPKEIRKRQHGDDIEGSVWILDGLWDGLRLHAEVGDMIWGLRAAPVVGGVVRRESGWHEAAAAGDAELQLVDGGRVRVSVTRRHFIGFADYRYITE